MHLRASCLEIYLAWCIPVPLEVLGLVPKNSWKACIWMQGSQGGSNTMLSYFRRLGIYRYNWSRGSVTYPSYLSLCYIVEIIFPCPHPEQQPLVIFTFRFRERKDTKQQKQIVYGSTALNARYGSFHCFGHQQYRSCSGGHTRIIGMHTVRRTEGASAKPTSSFHFDKRLRRLHIRLVRNPATKEAHV